MPDPVTDGVIGALVGGRYRIEALIGRGGTASVYRARDESLGRRVAIKLMQPMPGGAADLLRQRAEVETLAALNHHALVTLFDAGVDGAVKLGHAGGLEHAYLVMELVEGPDLRTRIERGRVDARQLAQITADLAEALHYVHSKGIVHRDIKPANVLLAPSELPGRDYHAKLADFGIAHLIDTSRLTAVGTVIGTASYLSPEQALGRTVGPATDIYALGLVAIEAMTGRRAFDGPSAESVQARLNRDPEIPEDAGDGWRALLESMTAREPLLRASAIEVAVTARELAARTNPGDVATADGAAAGVAPADSATKNIATAAPRTEDIATEAFQSLDFAALLDPTRRYPAPGTDASPASTAATAVFDVEAGAPREPSPGAPRKARTRAVLAASAVAVVALVALAVWLLPLAATAPSTGPSPYPSVSGQLGTHLKQLQESVTP